jgi:glycerophosphoryl diester phosphodiesterase
VPPELIGHRGSPRRARENTLAGFALALDAGATAVELDVHATVDGTVVVHHDPVLGAGAGPLAGAAIAALDAGRLLAHPLGDDGALVPTLDDVLLLCAGRATVYVEAKARDIEPAILAVLGRHPATRAAVHAFDHRVALRVAETAPTVPTGILVDSYLVDAAHALRTAGARDYWPHRLMVDAALVDAIHREGGRVIVWTVNDPREAAALAVIGVDGICTDVPDVVGPALR